MGLPARMNTLDDPNWPGLARLRFWPRKIRFWPGKIRSWRTQLGAWRTHVGVCLLIATGAVNAQWQIDKVLDGDSLMLRDRNGQRLSVRLAGIDAPERGQAFADRSRQNLRMLTANCTPEWIFQKIDRYGRSIGLIFCDGRDLGLAQLETGLAWHFSRYAKEQPFEQRTAYLNAQQRAQRASIGLWRDVEPMPPWSFREQRRGNRNNQARSPSS
jgi:endonuclease YncB( thermonuclease family)